MQNIFVGEIQIVPIKPLNGLVAFASAVINSQFFVGNIAVYSSPSSKTGFRLVFPTKKLSSGKHIDCFYPVSREAEEAVSRQIIDEYLRLMDNFHFVE